MAERVKDDTSIWLRPGVSASPLYEFSGEDIRWDIIGPPPDFGGANTPLRGRKAELFEGGIWVPCMMEWKNRLPAGRVIREPAAGIDLLPTLCALAQAPLPGPVDGQDLGPLLFGKRAPSSRELYWRTVGGEAYIMANWKYIRQENGEEFLFDLAADPNEATNGLLDVATLRRLKRGLGRLKATMP